MTEDVIIRMIMMMMGTIIMIMIMIMMMSMGMSVVKIMVFGGKTWPVGDFLCLPLSFSDNPLHHDLC